MKDKIKEPYPLAENLEPKFELIMELQRLNSIRNAKFALGLHEAAIKTAENIIKLAEEAGLHTHVMDQRYFIYKVQMKLKKLESKKNL